MMVRKKRSPFEFALAAIAASFLSCNSAPQASKEAALRDDLKAMRTVLEQYRNDKNEGPESLDQLVREGYIRKVPIDPFTRSSETWQVVRGKAAAGQAERPRVIDVRSGAKGIGRDGSAYSSW